MARFALTLSFLLFFTCGSDSDTSTDARPSTFDALVSLDASPQAVDAMGEVDAGTTPDAMAQSFGPVDCQNNDDCLGISTCTLLPPGGHCSGCGGSADCPLDFECVVGTCIRSCESDEDCSPGKKCSRGTGRCLIRSCANASCPAPYICNGINRCERPACESNNSCPDGFSCQIDEQVCTEN